MYFLFQFLKANLSEIDIASELEGNCIENWCLGVTVKDILTTLAFLFYWTFLGSTGGAE